MPANQSRNWKEIIQLVQSVATIIALLIAGLWALYLYSDQRQSSPRMNIEHAIESHLLTPEHRHVHLLVTHENRGTTLLKLHSGDVRLQQIRPLAPSISEKLLNGKNLNRDKEFFVRWPMVCRYVLNLEHELEPEESQEISLEFIISSAIKTLRIYSYFPNEEKQGIGWEKVTIHNLYRGNDATAVEEAGAVTPPNLCARDTLPLPE